MLFTLTAGGLVVAGAWLASLVVPMRRALRARNALLLERGAPGDFDWTPANVPRAFRRDDVPPPANIADAVERASVPRIEDSWLRARALVALLLAGWKADRPIRADLSTTFDGIMAGGGYCADYVRVYLAAAGAAGLFCRQWAFSFDGFGGHGHTVVEVWDEARARWAMLDVHNNVYAVLEGDETPLDAMTLSSALVSRPQAVAFRQAAQGRLGYPDASKLRDYYARGAREWYLWFGNDVASRERAAFVRTVARVSGTLAHRMQSVSGRLPRLLVPVTADNEGAVARMEALRTRLRAAGVLVVSLAALLAVQGGRSHA